MPKSDGTMTYAEKLAFAEWNPMSIEDNFSVTKTTHPFVVACNDPDCDWKVASKTEQEAQDAFSIHDRVACPMQSKVSWLLPERDERGRRYSTPHMGMSAIEKIWIELDASLAELFRQRDDSTDKKFMNPTLQGKCAGLAFALHSLDNKEYPAVEDVTKHAVVRYKIAYGSAEFEPTKNFHYNPPPPGSEAEVNYQRRMNHQVDVDKKPSSPTTPRPSSAKLDITTLKKEYSEQTLTSEQLMKKYGLSESKFVEIILS